MNRIFIHFRLSRRVKLLMAAGLTVFACDVHGQEALRMSLAGETIQESQRHAAATLGYYNLLTGPVAWRFASGLDLTYNDNVTLQQTNSAGDFIFRPNLDAEARWPVSQNNVLNFSLDAGYSAYLHRQELDSLYINPGSALTFDIFIGDLTINLHDQIAVTENAYENPASHGNGNNSRLQNTLGATATWNLNKLVLEGDYNHVNYASLASGGQQPGGSSDNLLLMGGVRLRSIIVAGVEAGGSLINYDQSAASASPDAMQWNAGVYCKAQISDYLNVRLDLGYTAYLPDTIGSLTNAGGTSGLDFQLSITHRLNKFVNYTLSAGRSVDLAFLGQPYEYYFVQLHPDWTLFNKIKLSTPLWWRQGTQLYNQAVSFDQYGAGINIGRNITRKLSGAFSYQFIRETSDQSGLNYFDDIVSLNFSYQF